MNAMRLRASQPGKPTLKAGTWIVQVGRLLLEEA